MGLNINQYLAYYLYLGSTSVVYGYIYSGLEIIEVKK